MAADDQPTDEFEPQAGTTPARVADPPLIASGRVLGQRYRLERRLGHGGMAVVWLATDERLGRPVAIKVISDTIAGDNDYLVRFRREAHTAAGLQHPHLVGVYDFDAGARPYLVMEYVGGGDLYERLKCGEAPDPRRLAEELLSALRHIHAAGVLHRDIKPQNVLVDELGNARLTDFGIAQPANATALTRTGHVIGTESYIAPEVKKGEAASERSDLFALGMVLAEAAEGSGDQRLWDLIERLRDPDPARRPGSAAAALATLERGRGRVLTGEPTAPYAIDDTEPTPRAAAAPPPFEPTSASKGALRRAIPALVAVLLVAGVIAGVVVATGDGDEGGGGQANAGGNAGAEKPAENESTTNPEPATSTPAAPTAPAEEGSSAPEETQPVSSSSEEDGYALEAEGYQAFLDGDYDAAIAASSQAVELLRGTGAPEYYYALFNLGTSLRHAGRPEEALPYLQERLEFDDNLEAVQAQIDLVEAELAGEDAKPGNGPKAGKTPPPFEADDE